MISRAEWVVLAHYLEIGCEGTFDDVEAAGQESFAELLEAFQALLALRTGSGKHDPYYLGNIGPPAVVRGKSPSILKPCIQSVKQLIRTLREPGSTLKPVFAGRNFYVAIRDEDLEDIAAVNHALLPHMPALFRFAARGHWLREQRPIRPQARKPGLRIPILDLPAARQPAISGSRFCSALKKTSPWRSRCPFGMSPIPWVSIRDSGICHDADTAEECHVIGRVESSLATPTPRFQGRQPTFFFAIA